MTRLAHLLICVEHALAYTQPKPMQIRLDEIVFFVGLPEPPHILVQVLHFAAEEYLVDENFADFFFPKKSENFSSEIFLGYGDSLVYPLIPYVKCVYPLTPNDMYPVGLIFLKNAL
jgi:hypothetical protein